LAAVALHPAESKRGYRLVEAAESAQVSKSPVSRRSDPGHHS